MARKSPSVLLTISIVIVFLTLAMFTSVIADNSDDIGQLPAITTLPIWLKFFASLVGAAVAISVLVLFTLKIWGSRDAGFAELGVWMIAFLAAITLSDTNWATVLALTLLTITHLVLEVLAPRVRALPPTGPAEERT